MLHRSITDRHVEDDWTVLRVASASSESVALEVFDTDLLDCVGTGRVGVAVLSPSFGSGWAPVLNEKRRTVGHVYVEFMKKKKSPVRALCVARPYQSHVDSPDLCRVFGQKPHAVIQPPTPPQQHKFRLAPDSLNGLGLRIASDGVVVGFSAPDTVAQAAGMPIGCRIVSLNGHLTQSRAELMERLEDAAAEAAERQQTGSGGWELDFIVELAGGSNSSDAGGGVQPADVMANDSEPSEQQFTVDAGRFYSFDATMEAFEESLAMFTERVDAVVLHASATHAQKTHTLEILTKVIHSIVIDQIAQLWSPDVSGRQCELEPTQLGRLLAWCVCHVSGLCHVSGCWWLCVCVCVCVYVCVCVCNAR